MKRGLAFLDCGAFTPLCLCDPKESGGKAPQSKGMPYFFKRVFSEQRSRAFSNAKRKPRNQGND
jgi:hypothetical protein